MNIMSGDAFPMLLFAMGISSYINASIIMQFLTIVPRSGENAEEGEEGRKKISKITRYVSVGLGLSGHHALLQPEGKQCISLSGETVTKFDFFSFIVLVTSFTAGTAVVVVGREYRAGNRQRYFLIIFAGIVGSSFSGLYVQYHNNYRYSECGASCEINVAAAILIVFLAVIAAVYGWKGERRIPVQYAKRCRKKGLRRSNTHSAG